MIHSVGVSGALVHEGFFEEYLSVRYLRDLCASCLCSFSRNQSLDAVRKALTACPQCSVTVTGHSLGMYPFASHSSCVDSQAGGALSILSVLDVASLAIGRSVTLTALSAPRVGNLYDSSC
jgi:hypothetical protein